MVGPRRFDDEFETVRPSPSEIGASSETCSPASRGFTLVELSALLATGTIALGMLVPTLRAERTNAKGPPDAARIRSIHQAWVTYAAENDGLYPTPGLINRQPVLGVQIPGIGAEDKFQNRTPFVHSACIMLGLYTPEMCVGTTEPSPNVIVKADYNWSAYDPAGDVYWDTTFSGVLSNQSNLSYASMPVAGERQLLHWRDDRESDWTIVGNRGVINGVSESPIFDNSITLRIHGSKKKWEGYACFSDNHYERLNTFVPEGLTYTTALGEQAMDNIFRNDDIAQPSSSAASGNDRWLTITTALFGTPDQITGVKNYWD